MTTTEWKATIKERTNLELIKDLHYFGCDPYYYDLWQTAMREIARRMGVKAKDLKELGLF